MACSKLKKQSVRLSVRLAEDECTEHLGKELDLSAAWMGKRAASEFVTRHSDKIEPGPSLRSAKPEVKLKTELGGSGGK